VTESASVTQPANLQPTITTVGVVGAGAMGAGIAQVAATAGHRVIVADSFPPAVVRARDSIERAVRREVEKGRLTDAAATELLARVRVVEVVPETGYAPFAECGIIIEAIVERLDIKQAAFRALERTVRSDCILATNTSSLSVTSIAAACEAPERVVGVHFFNPAPVMPLVEIIPALTTAETVRDAARALVESWGKITVVATDTPGFIVNRVARPFYGEAIRMLEEGVADIATIDWAIKEIGGFRMGPFELIDFIGQDINFAVTRSVFDGTFFDARYRPSVTQQRLVEAGFLGRKSGRGFYDYRDGAVPPAPIRDRSLGERIVSRALCMLINEAVDAVHRRLATVSDLEVAMTKGVNYPKGLLAWGEEIGFGRVLAHVMALQEEFGEDRYRPSPLLRRMAQEGTSFFA
jgi:3-hydroxybutyryl-CoA dehydrogenase